MVDEIYDGLAAAKMGLEEKGQVCVMIHSGSRGLGHQVATGELRGGGGKIEMEEVDDNSAVCVCVCESLSVHSM